MLTKQNHSQLCYCIKCWLCSQAEQLKLLTLKIPLSKQLVTQGKSDVDSTHFRHQSTFIGPSFQNVTYCVGLVSRKLAEDKCFQELLEEREGDWLKQRWTWCYKHLRHTWKGLKIHGDKSATENPQFGRNTGLKPKLETLRWETWPIF